MMDPHAYLAEIKARLAASPAVISISTLEEWALPDRGYFRARMILSNNDFLEVAEYFVVQKERCVPERYRYQWMDPAKQALRKRWDNVEHFPHLPNFPHHIHVGEEGNVEPGRLMSILELVAAIESELAGE